jgi:hypothetical protein
MELLILVFLYLLSQNPDFVKQLAPVMEKVRSSEDALRFLKDLSAFSELFCSSKKPKGAPQSEKKDAAAPHTHSPSHSEQSDCNARPPHTHEPPQNEKTPRSPTSGIADAFIEQFLSSYAQKRQ